MQQPLSLSNQKALLSPDLYHLLSTEGFGHTDWTRVPDEFLIYLFLHDEPTIGKRRDEKTKREYLRDILHFLRDVSIPLRELSSADVLAFQLRSEKLFAATTLRRKSTVIKQFLNYLRNRSIVPADIILKMKRVAQPVDQLVNRDFYEDEVAQLLQYFREKDTFTYTLLYILVSTGLRIHELTEAKWSALTKHRIKDKVYHFLRVTGKGNRTRDVIIYDDVLQTIFVLRRRRGLTTQLDLGDPTAFFAKPNGSHYSSTYLSSEFSKLIARAPFSFIQSRKDRITPHTCRHFTASFLSDKGADIRAIQDAMGHSSIRTTEKYLWRKRQLASHAGLRTGSTFFD